MKCHRSALSLCFSDLILCTAVSGGWVWSSSSTWRYNGVLVCRPVLFMQHRVCLRPSIEDSADPQTLSWEKRAGTINSLFFACQGLHSSAFFVWRRQLWLVYSRQWVGAGLGSLVFFFFFPPPKSQMDQSSILITFYSDGWWWRTLLFHPINMQNCGMGVAWIICEETIARFKKHTNINEKNMYLA